MNKRTRQFERDRDRHKRLTGVEDLNESRADVDTDTMVYVDRQAAISEEKGEWGRCSYHAHTMNDADSREARDGYVLRKSTYKTEDSQTSSLGQTG